MAVQQETQRIAAFGELMLDVSLGSATGVAFDQTELHGPSTTSLGGIGTVVSALAQLGTTPVMFATIGDDWAASILRSLLDSEPAIDAHVSYERGPSFVRVLSPREAGRVIVWGQDMERNSVAVPSARVIHKELRQSNCAALVVADFGHLPPETIAAGAGRIPLRVATMKDPARIALFRGFDLIVVSRSDVARRFQSHAVDGWAYARSRDTVSALLLTDEGRSASLFASGERFDFSVPNREAVNPVGAGDLLTAALVHHLASNHALEDAVRRAIGFASESVRNEFVGHAQKRVFSIEVVQSGS